MMTETVEAAGGPTSNDGSDGTLASVSTPAADVCVWTTLALDPMGYGWMRASCNGFESHERGLINQNPPYKCPSCGKPISFKENQNG